MAKQISPGASSGSSYMSGQPSQNESIVANKRNNLKEMASEDLGIQKGRPASPSKSEQPQFETEPRMGGFKQHNSSGPTSGKQPKKDDIQSIMNTPLASAMKKVGMTPAVNSQLNDFLKKKMVPLQNNMYSSTSNSASPRVMSSMNDDGTAG